MPSEAESRTAARPISIAVAALGGQGGGVLSFWIVATAERCGYIAQSTSVPGVAQRTGATIYSIELFPRAAAEKAGKEPVLALTPMPGDVDIVIAAELMEAGRAINRGLVTRDLTTLILSSHRDYAIGEKIAMGNGAVDADAVLKGAKAHARRLIAFDMKQLASASGSVISAALFGALAGSGALSLPRAAFEETIRDGGRMVEENLAAFSAAYERAQANDAPPVDPQTAADDRPAARSPETRAILERIGRDFPKAAHALLVEGARRCVDYQDPAYAGLYLSRLEPFVPAEDPALLQAAARHLALWMSYEDTIRVADLKTRGSRFARAHADLQAGGGQIVYLSEFMHPRLEELADTLPAPLGRFLLRSAAARALLRPFLKKGRRIETAKLSGFFLLRLIASARRIRRLSLRYERENRQIKQWLDRLSAIAARDRALAVEIARCQRLVKGYGDTHDHGMRNFLRLMQAADRLVGRGDAARLLAELRDLALADDTGERLAERVKTLG